MSEAAEIAIRNCAIALRIAKRHDVAEHVLKTGLDFFPGVEEIRLQYAVCAAEHLGAETQEARWRSYLRDFPRSPSASYGLAMRLMHNGNLHDAEQIFTEAFKSHPKDFHLRYGFAHALSKGRNWRPAIAAWEALAIDFPNDPHIRNAARIYVSDYQSDAISHEGAFPVPKVLFDLINDAGEEQDQIARRKGIFAKFESMGSNCEFGLIQRMCGLEPLGLLRWSSALPSALAHAVRSSFQGIDCLDDVLVEVTPETREYITKSKLYEIVFHSWTLDTNVEISVFTKQHARRLSLLKDKFLEELSTDDKIFLYKDGYDSSIDDLANLHDSMVSQDTKACLLCVKLADATNVSGTLKLVKPNMHVGFVERFDMADPPIESWEKICSEALFEMPRKADASSN